MISPFPITSTSPHTCVVPLQPVDCKFQGVYDGATGRLTHIEATWTPPNLEVKNNIRHRFVVAGSEVSTNLINLYLKIVSQYQVYKMVL